MRPKNAQPRAKRVPSETTHAESYYYLKQMQSRTAVTLVMRDGEELAGVIEWYDRDCIKLNRENAPNLMVYKDCIKYVYKSEQSADDEEDLDERED